MEKIKSNYFEYAILLILVGTMSCNSFLNEIVDNRVTNLESGQKLSELLVYAYTNANYQHIMEASTDNVGDSGSTVINLIPLNESIYKFEDYNKESSVDSPVYFWNQAYNAIAYANVALETIEKLGNPKNLNPQRGEALLCRAYNHFLLTSIFGYRYEPNSTDLGIKYMKHVEKHDVNRYKRGTISENFEDIKNDLEIGLPLITDDYVQPKFHFTKEASYAFASRFYLQLGDWDSVIKYADLVLKGKTANQIVRQINTEEYISLNKSDLEQFYADYNAPQNLLVSEPFSYYYLYLRLSNKFGLTNSLRQVLFDSNRIPFSTTAISWAYDKGRKFVSRPGGVIYYSPKFLVINNKLTLVHFRTEEVLLNRAEAYVMKNDFTNALVDLKTFLSGRIIKSNLPFDITNLDLTMSNLNRIFPVVNNELTPFYSLSDEQRILVKTILEYKRLEFIHEGLRWLDIKRFNIIVTHETNGVNYILGKDDPRRAIQIPELAIATGMQPNPR